MSTWPTATCAEGWGKAFLRIGHGGAAGHALQNSLVSLDLALRMGVDVVEFDVRPCKDGLVLLHDDTLEAADGAARAVADCTLDELQRVAADRGGFVSTVGEALDLVRGRALLNLDLKASGCEEAVLALLRARGMVPDTLISSLEPESLRRLRVLEPEVLTGFSYPEDKSGASGNRYLEPIVDLAIAVMRLALPYRVAGMMARAQANAVMIYHRVISKAAAQKVHALGGKVFVWTVDEEELLQRVQGLGVDGVATNHPDLFEQPA